MSIEEKNMILEMVDELEERASIAIGEANYDDALKIYREILKAYEALKMERNCGLTLLTMAKVLLLQGKVENARELVDIASDINSLAVEDKNSVEIPAVKYSVQFQRPASLKACGSFLIWETFLIVRSSQNW